jgi:hypothetical protein
MARREKNVNAECDVRVGFAAASHFKLGANLWTERSLGGKF